MASESASTSSSPELPPETAQSRTDQPNNESTDTSSNQLPLDIVFGILSSERRRLVLRYLQDEPETTLGALAEHIAAIENQKPEKALTSSERKRVYIGLYQCHLPQMDDANVINFNQARGTVELGETADQFDQYLTPTTTSTDDAQQKRYVLAGVSVGISTVILLGIYYPSIWLTGLLVTAIVSLIMVTIARKTDWARNFRFGTSTLSGLTSTIGNTSRDSKK